MTRIGLACLVVVLLAPRAEAHQLDEYLQAARLDISRDRVGIELDLTPGISIAPQLIALIDADADGSVSDAEMGAYATQVLRELSLRVDGQPLALTLTRATFPAWADVREGTGTIRLEAVAAAGVAREGLAPDRLRERASTGDQRVPGQRAETVRSGHRDWQPAPGSAPAPARARRRGERQARARRLVCLSLIDTGLVRAATEMVESACGHA